MNDWKNCIITEIRKKPTNDAECCACCVFNGDDVEADIEEQTGGLSSETFRVLCLPRTTSEILLSNMSMVVGTFCQQNQNISRASSVFTQ